MEKLHSSTTQAESSQVSSRNLRLVCPSDLSNSRQMAIASLLPQSELCLKDQTDIQQYSYLTTILAISLQRARR